MKLFLILATLVLSAPARAESVAYVDVSRVYQEAAESKRIVSEIQHDREAKQAEVSAAQSAFTKAKPTERQALQEKAAKLAQMDETDFDAHVAKATADRQTALTKVVAQLKAERHIATVLPVVPIDPKLGSDLTDEVIKRWNASVVPTVSELEQKLADSNARVAAAEARLDQFKKDEAERKKTVSDAEKLAAASRNAEGRRDELTKPPGK